MFRKVLGLFGLSLLAACASGEAPQILASTRTVDSSHAYALPPPGGPSIVSVIERPYNNAVQQEILLATSARTPGQNVLRVQFFGPVKPNLSAGDTLRDRQLGVTDISRELRGTLPGIAMRRSDNYVQNRYGPFGFASGQSQSGDTCIFAWQRIRPAESQTRWLTGRGTIQIRLRLCDSHLNEEQLLAFMYGFSINAAFNNYSWNPYGEPAGPASDLGRPGPDIYPSGPGLPSAEAMMPAPATEPAPRRVAVPVAPTAPTTPVRPAPRGPIVPPPPGSPDARLGQPITLQSLPPAATTPAGNTSETIVPPPPVTGQ